MKIYVRKAKNSDREAVFRFCEKTWSWGDYIQEVWDDWLKDKNGRVFVATINGVPVGISKLSIDKPHEVWLSGARTDPNYRRIGVATAITKKCLKYARQNGAKVARLVTESDNMAARVVLKKIGFKPITEFVEMTTDKIMIEKGTNSRFAEKTETEVLLRYIQKSRIYHKAAGLYTVLFHWFSLEKEDLERFVTQQKAIVHSNSKGEIDGLTLIDDAPAREWHENAVQTCYLDGKRKAITDMMRFLETICATSGIKKIYAFTCNYRPILKALEELNFKLSGSTKIVYEKRIS
ncbi:MAG: GNAT family N-acetyltransferase [Candidatus Bathyarchaeales archaeon]